uniref:Uncharacterized protein n=1 Tax=Hyaloperonospora arabidopsidis (strain Emoy2) TaxID=559515 RepID=M4BLT9_HYAAE
MGCPVSRSPRILPRSSFYGSFPLPVTAECQNPIRNIVQSFFVSNVFLILYREVSYSFSQLQISSFV